MFADKEFENWLIRVSHQEKPPDSVIAYNIGLFETSAGYSVYLVGASTFDEQNGDWACEEVFTPSERYFSISLSEPQTWDVVLAQVVEATRKFLKSKAGEYSFLASAKAVTVGFDDGDLVRVK